MEKAFLCPGCGASVILKDGPVEACCFCGAKLVEKDVKDRPEGGFYFGALDKASLSVGTCRQCGKKMYASFGSEVKMASCLCCGSSDIVTETTETVLPKTLTFAPFSYTLSDAK